MGCFFGGLGIVDYFCGWFLFLLVSLFMRVLVCIPCLLIGGTEIQTLSLVEALVSAGHRVDVACYFEFAREMVRRYERAGACVHLLSLGPRQSRDKLNTLCLGDDDGDGHSQARTLGSRPCGVRATVGLLWRGLGRVVREVRPDVAHVQYMAPGALPILVLRALGVRNIVATAHTAADIYSRGGLRLLRWLNRRVLRGFQCITLVAERSFFGCGQLFDRGMKLRGHGNHFTVYNNIPSYISLRDGERRRGDVVTVGVVSRLEGIKGMDLVVPAMARVFAAADAAGVRCRLLVVGDGSLRELMERQTSELGLADRVEFAGRRGQDELQGFYDRMDVLLMPSRSEGFGLTAVEGMARGCVPVVADVGGLPEVVVDGESGLLHERESVESLSGQVERVVCDAGLWGRLSAGALERAGCFGLEAYRGQIGDWYDSLFERTQDKG